MLPTDIIPAFDSYLNERGLRFEATIVGGAALSLLGVVIRPTDDCDVLDPVIPEPIIAASESFATLHQLDTDWFNCKSHDFIGIPGCMPTGWRSRLRPAFVGTALTLHTLGRQDLLCTKLVALVDRSTDFEDCIALNPTTAELKAAWPFVANYEGNPDSREVYWIPLAKKRMAHICEELNIDAIF